jgi:hypothetical protein
MHHAHCCTSNESIRLLVETSINIPVQCHGCLVKVKVIQELNTTTEMHVWKLRFEPAHRYSWNLNACCTPGYKAP